MNSRAEIAQDADRSPPALRPGIGTHYLRYSFSNGMVLLAGFISFPIVTRLLDNTQFGLLRYYETLMLLGVAIVKLGTQHAIVRFYPYDGDAAQMRAFGTNFVLVPLLMSLAMWLLCAVGVALWAWIGNGEVTLLAWCALAMVPIMAASSIVQMVVRASERSDIVMFVKIAGRMLELVLVLGALFFLQASALAVYGGKIAAAVLLLAWLARWGYRHIHVARDAIDWRTVRIGLIFGLPLMAHELAFSLLAHIDRVLLKQLTGDFAVVGIYAIGYALAMQLNVFIDATLYEAFTPVVTRTYESGGNDAVRELKRRVLMPMTYAVVGIIAMLLVSGHDVLVALSGRAKAASGAVFVVVGITVSTYALFAISNYGLQLKHQTMRVLTITVGAAVLNVALNLVLIPRMGYMGAAWATAISYGALAVAQFIVCPKGLAQLPEPRVAGLSLACAATLVAVALGTDLFELKSAWLRLCAAGTLFVALYALPVLALDSRVRAMASALLQRTR